MTANPWVRPYVLTGGRTRTRKHPLVHTLVSVDRYDPIATAAAVARGAAAVRAAAAWAPQSVAELSAHCGVSLGVTRVLLEDLAAAELVRINDDALVRAARPPPARAGHRRPSRVGPAA